MDVDLLEDAVGLVGEDILQDDDVTGLGDGVVGLGGDYHAESLKAAGNFEAGLASGEFELAEILRTTVGGDCPEDIGEVLGTEAVGGSEVLEVSVDVGLAGEGVHLSVALSRGHEIGAGEADVGGPAAVEIVDSIELALDYVDVIDVDAVGTLGDDFGGFGAGCEGGGVGFLGRG